MATLRSACPLDCPDTCSLEVEVSDGQLVSLDGSKLNPLTDGFICGKVRGIKDHVYGDERLRYPLIRTGPKGEATFRRASWDEALTRIARDLGALAAAGRGEAILPLSYGGSNGFLTQDTTDARLFHRLGASRLARTVCAAPSSAAAKGLYGKMPGVSFTDFVHAQLIVVWGCNPSATGIHQVPLIKQARAQGAKIVVVDPRSIPLAKQADLHLPVRPGADLPLALSVIRWLFETGNADTEFLATHATGAERLREAAAVWDLDRTADVTGVPATRIEAFAEMYASASPALLRCGWGPERSRSGGSATAAILALPAVAGKFGVRGGGYTASNSGAWTLDSLAAANAAKPSTRVINMNRVGVALTTPDEAPIELLFVYNCNPLATLPNQEAVRRGLLRDDLTTVVFEQVMTDTARYGDVVLPATTFLEHQDLRRGYGSTVITDILPVIDPVGEARANAEVFQELCERTGVQQPDDPATTEAQRAAVLSSNGELPEVERQLTTRGQADPPVGPAPIQFRDSFPHTEGRKVHLFPESLDAEADGLYVWRPDPGTQKHPLSLISPALASTVTSTFAQLIRRIVPLQMHPTDAAVRGLESGSRVRVFNEYGEVHTDLKVTTEVRPGTVVLPKGLWSQHTHNGSTANALSPDTLADLGGGACFNDARVDVADLNSGKPVN